MKAYLVLFSMLIAISAFSCKVPDPNARETGEDELKSRELSREIDKSEMEYQDVVYVPIYSDIYIDEQNQKSLLAATLSIRNTSYVDSLFISKIDYFNTSGELVRNFLGNTISLPPMGTINYVIEKHDDTGGAGANFIVVINARSKNVRPVVQAIMIGENGNKGFSFSTDGYSIPHLKKETPIE